MIGAEALIASQFGMTILAPSLVSMALLAETAALLGDRAAAGVL